MAAQAGPASGRAVIAGAEPQLFVADITAACGFYTGKLGFAVVFTYGEPPYYGQVKRDRARLNLRCVEAPVIDSALRDREELLAATLMVNSTAEIEQLFAEFQSAGVGFAQTLYGKALGREGLHHQGSRREPVVVRRSRAVAPLCAAPAIDTATSCPRTSRTCHRTTRQSPRLPAILTAARAA